MQENIQAALSLCQSLSSVFFGCQHCCCSYKKLTFARSVSNFAGKFPTIPRWDVPLISKFPVGFLSSLDASHAWVTCLPLLQQATKSESHKTMNDPGKTELNSSKNRASLNIPLKSSQFQWMWMRMRRRMMHWIPMFIVQAWDGQHGQAAVIQLLVDGAIENVDKRMLAPKNIKFWNHQHLFDILSQILIPLY